MIYETVQKFQERSGTGKKIGARVEKLSSVYRDHSEIVSTSSNTDACGSDVEEEAGEAR